MHISLSQVWKQRLAHLMQFRFLQVFMVWGIYLFTPRHRVGVNVVLLDAQQRVLLLKHIFHPRAPWGLPGGWLGKHEDPLLGALRELREETGLTAVVEQILVLEHVFQPAHIGIIYLARVGPESLTLNGEILDAKWFELAEVPRQITVGTARALVAATAVVEASAVVGDLVEK
jgi:ADP-ribose pyrophosphatase YjhB (NUDIX family)